MCFCVRRDELITTIIFEFPNQNSTSPNFLCCCWDVHAYLVRLDVCSNASAHCISSGLVFLFQKDSLAFIEVLPLLLPNVCLASWVYLKSLWKGEAIMKGPTFRCLQKLMQTLKRWRAVKMEKMVKIHLCNAVQYYLLATFLVKSLQI